MSVSEKKQPARTDSRGKAAAVAAPSAGATGAARAALERRVQSAAAPSPFPPIADYAFLSNCHTGALLAPDGSIDWLCVPRFDSPSVFGSLLDREGGLFRLAPYGVNVPSARYYEPGTNVMVTTWKLGDGWIQVRDAIKKELPKDAPKPGKFKLREGASEAPAAAVTEG